MSREGGAKVCNTSTFRHLPLHWWRAAVLHRRWGHGKRTRSESALQAGVSSLATPGVASWVAHSQGARNDLCAESMAHTQFCEHGASVLGEMSSGSVLCRCDRRRCTHTAICRASKKASERTFPAIPKAGLSFELVMEGR